MCSHNTVSRFQYWYALNLCQTCDMLHTTKWGKERKIFPNTIFLFIHERKTFLPLGERVKQNLHRDWYFDSMIEVFWITLYTGTPHISCRDFTTVMLSTWAKLLQWLRYLGFYFTQVPHTYSVYQPLSSHLYLSRRRKQSNWKKRIENGNNLDSWTDSFKREPTPSHLLPRAWISLSPLK